MKFEHSEWDVEYSKSFRNDRRKDVSQTQEDVSWVN